MTAAITFRERNALEYMLPLEDAAPYAVGAAIVRACKTAKIHSGGDYTAVGSSVLGRLRRQMVATIGIGRWCITRIGREVLAKVKP